ncbi:MAG TPA: Re/Si-specific NAD(P)(+) transhydrogenase subunit alpha [Thermoanaerobaculia bacterium]|nr:Re/Si-specific NAD(P)(+) transhydrogenase subunit alpha [Thermoanaerobaculia bacterium]
MPAVVFVPKESQPREQRVAATPETVRQYVRNGLEVRVERGAGERALFTDADYEAAGATIEPAPIWSAADLVLKVSPPGEDEASAMKEGSLLIAFMAANRNLGIVRTLVRRRVTVLAMELIPRTTKAQPMDALSSQASIAGYKAVVVAAAKLPKYFPLLMTAAGTIKPAKVVIMGAGVAGLQAVATAKRLGAVVEVSDIREAVKEQVESLGGKFIELPMQESGEGAGGYAREMGEDFLRRQREIVSRHVAHADVVVTTAQIPGKKAPVLVTREMVDGMRRGSIVVDLAVDSGGNCELSQPDREIEHGGVLVIGNSNFPAETAHDASTLYARNVQALLLYLLHEGAVRLDLDDEITAGSTLVHDGAVRHSPTAALLEGGR